jgi:hypothetical protein
MSDFCLSCSLTVFMWLNMVNLEEILPERDLKTRDKQRRHWYEMSSLHFTRVQTPGTVKQHANGKYCWIHSRERKKENKR